MALPFDIFSEHAPLRHKAREISTFAGSDVQTELDDLRGQIHWLSPVSRYDLLPLTGNTIGDVRMASITRELFAWIDFDAGWKLDWHFYGLSSGTVYFDELDNNTLRYTNYVYSGHLLPKYSEQYTFVVQLSPEVWSLKIDGVEILNQTMYNGAFGDYRCTYTFSAGQYYNIQLTHDMSGGTQDIHVEWFSTSQPRAFIGKSDLIYDITPQWVPIKLDLTHINDFLLSNINKGDIVKYNGKKWVNEPGVLSKVNDVTITTPTQHDILSYDYALLQWVNLSNTLDNMADVVIVEPRYPHQTLEFNGDKWANINPINPQHFYLKGVIPNLIKPGHPVGGGLSPEFGSGYAGDGNPEPLRWTTVDDLTQTINFAVDGATALFRWRCTVTKTSGDGYDVYCAVFIDGVEVPGARDTNTFTVPIADPSPATLTFAGESTYPITKGEHLVELKLNIRMTSQIPNFTGTLCLVDVDRFLLVAELGGGTTGGTEALTTLTDVSIATPTTGQLLKYNGTKWVNATITPPSHLKASALGTSFTSQDINTDSYTAMLDMHINFTTSTTALLRIQWSCQLYLADPHSVTVTVFVDGNEIDGAYRIGGLNSASGLTIPLDVSLGGMCEVPIVSGSHIVELKWFNELGHTASTLETNRILWLEDISP
jgi:hypothetical protein